MRFVLAARMHDEARIGKRWGGQALGVQDATGVSVTRGNSLHDRTGGRFPSELLRSPDDAASHESRARDPELQ